MNTIEIYTSKKKSILLLVGSLLFVGLGIWFIIDADNFSGWRARSPLVTRGIGIAAVLFFGLGIFIGVKRIIKSEIALIISPFGLNVNPRRSQHEFIKWNEISGFNEIKIQTTRILIIGVKNPNYWMEKETNTLRKKMMQFNIKNYGSPFNIAASGLDISSSELNQKLKEYYERFNEGN